MDTPPTYQEATAKKRTWLQKLVGIFKSPKPSPGQLIERKSPIDLFADFGRSDTVGPLLYFTPGAPLIYPLRLVGQNTSTK
jgi:hypothetical protein